MQRYVEQLIEDLNEAAEKQHTSPYIEPPAEIEVDPMITELAMTPYKTIEKLTGIEQIVFPRSFRLSDKHISLILSTIFKLLDSFNIDLVDKPDYIPNEILYDVLVEYWSDYVQYLPSSGFDLEVCTGDSDTCPYLGFCNCDEDFLDEDEPPAHFSDNEDPEMPF